MSQLRALIFSSRYFVIQEMLFPQYACEIGQTNRPIESVMHFRPQIILIDGVEDIALTLCEQLKASEFAHIPRLFLLNGDFISIDTVLSAGADDVVMHPLHHQILMRRANNLVHQKLVSPIQEARILQTLATIAKRIANDADLSSICSYILQQLSYFVAFDNATVLQIQQGHVQEVAFWGRPRAINSYDNIARTPLGWSIRHAEESVIITDSMEIKDYNIASDWARAFLCVPLAIDAEVFGLLLLASARPATYSRHSDTLTRPFAALTALSICYRRLYDTMLRQMDEITVLYRATSLLLVADNLSAIARYIQQSINDEFKDISCMLALVDDNDPDKLWEIRADGAHQPLVENELLGYIREAMLSGYSVCVSNDKAVSYFVTPLIIRNKTIGVLGFLSRHINAFEGYKQRILQSFADHLSSVIENIRLLEVQRQYTEQLENRMQSDKYVLTRTQEQFEKIFDNSLDAMVILDAGGRVIRCNSASRVWLGQINGHLASDWVMPDDQFTLQKAIADVLDRRSDTRIELNVQTLWHPAVADVVLFPIVGIDGVVHIVCSLRDITERRQMERNLIQAVQHERDLNELRSRFITTVSHGFRTPLARILTSSNLIRLYRQRLTEEQIDDKLAHIEEAVMHMTQLVEEALAVTQTPYYMPLALLIGPFCREIADSFWYANSVSQRLIYEEQGQAVYTLIDTHLMGKVLSEIFSNAVKFSQPTSTIYCRIVYGEDNVLIGIADEGIGIAETDQSYLFDIFHRGKNAENIEGAGLGLAIAKQIIALHNGVISLESQLNRGTKVTISIPTHRREIKV